jgi:hypothetical protein
MTSSLNKRSWRVARLLIRKRSVWVLSRCCVVPPTSVFGHCVGRKGVRQTAHRLMVLSTPQSGFDSLPIASLTQSNWTGFCNCWAMRTLHGRFSPASHCLRIRRFLRPLCSGKIHTLTTYPAYCLAAGSKCNTRSFTSRFIRTSSICPRGARYPLTDAATP